jgi:predicted RNA-binding protein Jag
VDTVQTRILDFSLKLEAENPNLGETQSGLAPIPSEKLRPMVINTFYGPVGNVAQHSEKFSQSAEMANDTEELARFVQEFSAHLHELGLDERQELRAKAQIEVIQTELEGDPDDGVIAQSGRTLRNICEGTVGSLIATAAQPAIWQWFNQMLKTFQ